jgi:hypothetical protein
VKVRDLLAVDIEIVVYLGLGGNGDDQLKEALRAAKILEDLGFVVAVVPVTVEWDFVSIGHYDEGPLVQVNGSTIASGRVARAEEIVALALASLGGGHRSEPLPFRSRGNDGGEVSVSVAS